MSFRQRGIEHSALGFYGFIAPPGAAKAIYQAAVRWFEELACQPHLMGTTYGKGRLIKFETAAAKLQKHGFDDLKNFQIDSLPPGAQNELEGMNLHVAWSLARQTLAISARTSVASLSHESLLPIAKDVINILEPEYGFGFRRDEHLTPGLFVIGLSSNEPDTREGNEEGLSIAGWGSPGINARCWRHGFLRDVYPWNFLTLPQLTASVGHGTLRGWIDKGAHGTLVPLARDMFLWEMPEREIPMVRSVLRNAGLVFEAAVYDKIYYGTPEGHLLPKEEIMRRMSDSTYVRDVAPPPSFSSEEVLRQVLGDAAAGDVRVLHIDKSGGKPEIRELSTEDVRTIQKRKRKKQ